MNFLTLEKGFIAVVLLLFLASLNSCSSSSDDLVDDEEIIDDDFEKGKMPEEFASDVVISKRADKISQIVGDDDIERQENTQNRTETRYKIRASDLGVPFTYKTRTYVLFGDTHGAEDQAGVDRDVIAYTTDNDLEDGVSLKFLNNDGVYRPIEIPGVSMGAFEVPTEGVEAHEAMYIYVTTDHSEAKTMGRSVLARSDDDGMTFEEIYSLSSQFFINVSIVKADASDWDLLPEDMDGKVLVIYGSGMYRESDVYLAVQPEEEIEDKESFRYFAGLDEEQKPIWSKEEQDAVALFDHPQVGELSVTYNPFIERWIMLYNAGEPQRGINMRTAESPWEWSKTQVVFDPVADGGYGSYMHISCEADPEHCDDVFDLGRENEYGGEYGPYQYPDHAKGNKSSKETTIYFNMSTWNPYTVVLMSAELRLEE